MKKNYQTYTGPLYKASFNELVKLPDLPLEKKEQGSLYKKASSLGKAPYSNGDLSSNNINVQIRQQSRGLDKNQHHKTKKYSQQQIDFLESYAVDLHCAVINTTAAFARESYLDSGLVLNFVIG